MKEEALKLADELIHYCLGKDIDTAIVIEESAAMIRRLVEELDEKEYRISNLEMLVANRNEIIDKLDLKPQTKCTDCGEVNPAEIHTCSPQTERCNGFCGEQECKENDANCSRLLGGEK
jgi:ArsR family metal-binding transcriptional regulator